VVVYSFPLSHISRLEGARVRITELFGIPIGNIPFSLENTIERNNWRNNWTFIIEYSIGIDPFLKNSMIHALSRLHYDIVKRFVHWLQYTFVLKSNFYVSNTTSLVTLVEDLRNFMLYFHTRARINLKNLFFKTSKKALTLKTRHNMLNWNYWH